MYYQDIYDFIMNLNSENIEELKPLLKKYTIELILSAKEDSGIPLEELECILNLKRMKDEFNSEIALELESEGLKFGLLTDEFVNIYMNFTREIEEKGYIKDAIDLNRSILKALDCMYRDVYLVKRNNCFNENGDDYLISNRYLRDLEQEIIKRLSDDVNNISKEYLNILGLVEYIKNQIEEKLDEISNIFISQLRDKSLEEFNKEVHLSEYKCVFTHEYIRELKRRKYEWTILSSKLTTNYFRDELYENLD